MKGNSVICRTCGEKYTQDDLTELRDMGETYYLKGTDFFCPDCWDDYQHLTLEEQFELLMRHI